STAIGITDLDVLRAGKSHARCVRRPTQRRWAALPSKSGDLTSNRCTKDLSASNIQNAGCVRRPSWQRRKRHIVSNLHLPAQWSPSPQRACVHAGTGVTYSALEPSGDQCTALICPEARPFTREPSACTERRPMPFCATNHAPVPPASGL